MPAESLAEGLLLPELSLIDIQDPKHSGVISLYVEKTSEMEVCPKCAHPADAIYDRRWVRVRDENIRARRVWLWIHKRRFFCKRCDKPFTEPVPGIRKGYRTTQRFRKSIQWACERFGDLKSVMRQYRISSGFVYKAHYEELERRRRTRMHPWPRVVGLDEHFFRHNEHRCRDFVSMVVDYKNKSLFEVVEGRQAAQLKHSLSYIPGRENVETVVMDMYEPYRKFTREFFPEATIVADQFHVLRLLNPWINRRRKEITGDKRSHPIRWMLLKNKRRLKPKERWALFRWLDDKPEIRELYQFKEALHRLYRTRGYGRAQRALTKLTDLMSLSILPEIKSLRRTLMRWRQPILAYFKIRVTHARTEGFNAKAKLVKKRAYGYRSFENYRLRLLNACT
jgi:transposase